MTHSEQSIEFAARVLCANHLYQNSSRGDQEIAALVNEEWEGWTSLASRVLDIIKTSQAT